MKTRYHIKSVSINDSITQFSKDSESKKYTEILPGETLFFDLIVHQQRQFLLEQRQRHDDGYEEVTIETIRTYQY
ncbi:hypothetical protein J4466_05155 [Candidatus Pacearchaeota archaeon]|nr:hypothetical protein [Candidatus Pacearchaeota archaeon]